VGFAQLQLQTLFTFDDDGYLVETREPESTRAPRLAIVRTKDEVAWAVRRDTPPGIADLASKEPPAADWSDPPLYADTYQARLNGTVFSGPAFIVPDAIDVPDGVVRADGYYPGRAPIYVAVEDGVTLSVCHCARSSPDAAEAGLFTEAAHRGRGLGPRVTTAWAAAIRASDRVPIYSTSWDNAASRAVARKLGCEICATDYSVT
jgi:RimJ/RimL family protein N-acetyltransferase